MFLVATSTIIASLPVRRHARDTHPTAIFGCQPGGKLCKIQFIHSTLVLLQYSIFVTTNSSNFLQIYAYCSMIIDFLEYQSCYAYLGMDPAQQFRAQNLVHLVHLVHSCKSTSVHLGSCILQLQQQINFIPMYFNVYSCSKIHIKNI